MVQRQKYISNHNINRKWLFRSARNILKNFEKFVRSCFFLYHVTSKIKQFWQIYNDEFLLIECDGKCEKNNCDHRDINNEAVSK